MILEDYCLCEKSYIALPDDTNYICPEPNNCLYKAIYNGGNVITFFYGNDFYIEMFLETKKLNITQIDHPNYHNKLLSIVDPEIFILPTIAAIKQRLDFLLTYI